MFGLCGGGPAGIAGLVTNENNETVENVQMNLTGGMQTPAQAVRRLHGNVVFPCWYEGGIHESETLYSWMASGESG